ncbi:MAG TPA: zinc ribbon domain-containing protein [Spirochaetota bacterium]|jgi:putative FmdB family regulatory protein|nr:zinc ribbon domain-containing protein [Spirochaetota bacterium]HPV42577.1 zinc ribbon domain-containing protein [Spirochaetota bacterium]
MPTYEYECLECKNRFEVFQSINDEPIMKCEKCSGKVRKLFGTAGIIFKGSGFYVNDYKKNGGSKRNYDKGNSSEKPSCPSADSCSTGCSSGASE